MNKLGPVYITGWWFRVPQKGDIYLSKTGQLKEKTKTNYSSKARKKFVMAYKHVK